MKPVPMATSPDVLVRALDVMSVKKVYTMLSLFLAVNAVLVCCLVFGPPQSHTEMVHFDTASVAKNSKKFHIHAGPFNYLNSYVVVDVVFVRPDAHVDPNFGFTSSVLGHVQKGRRKSIVPDKQVAYEHVPFDSGSAVSRRSRLFSKEITDFENLELEIVMRYTFEQQVSGVFIVFYSDIGYSCIEILIRLVFFFVTAVVLVYLEGYDIKNIAGPFQIVIIKGLLFVSVVASNPLNAFSYFTESFFFPLVDSLLCIFLIVLTASATLVLIDMMGLSQGADFDWILRESAPFLIAGFLYLLNDLISHIRLRDETDMNVPTALYMLSYLRSIAAGLCFVRILLALLTMNTASRPQQILTAAMIMVTFVFCLGSELASVKPHISAHQLQIYTYAAIATYILFLAKCYWPTDPDAEESQDGYGDSE